MVSSAHSRGRSAEARASATSTTVANARQHDPKRTSGAPGGGRASLGAPPLSAEGAQEKDSRLRRPQSSPRQKQTNLGISGSGISAAAAAQLQHLKTQVQRLQRENGILGRAIEELLRKRDTSAILQNLFQENMQLRDRLQHWKGRALAEAAVIEDLRDVTMALPARSFCVVGEKPTFGSSCGESTSDKHKPRDRSGEPRGQEESAEREGAAAEEMRLLRQESASLRAEICRERQARFRLEADRARDLLQIARLEQQAADSSTNGDDRPADPSYRRSFLAVTEEQHLAAASSDTAAFATSNIEVPLEDGGSGIRVSAGADAAGMRDAAGVDGADIPAARWSNGRRAANLEEIEERRRRLVVQGDGGS